MVYRAISVGAAATAALLVIGCGASHDVVRPSQPPARLVISIWVADPLGTAGPYPGFRPQLTEITPAMVQSVTASPDPNGGPDWVITVTFDPAGTAIYSRLSTDAYRACGAGAPGFVIVSPGCHLTAWLDLTQADLDQWSTQAARLYQPVDRGGKLISDPTVVEPITSGMVIIEGNFTQRHATALAARIHA